MDSSCHLLFLDGITELAKGHDRITILGGTSWSIRMEGLKDVSTDLRLCNRMLWGDYSLVASGYKVPKP